MKVSHVYLLAGLFAVLLQSGAIAQVNLIKPVSLVAEVAVADDDNAVLQLLINDETMFPKDILLEPSQVKTINKWHGPTLIKAKEVGDCFFSANYPACDPNYNKTAGPGLYFIYEFPKVICNAVSYGKDAKQASLVGIINHCFEFPMETIDGPCLRVYVRVGTIASALCKDGGAVPADPGK